MKKFICFFVLLFLIFCGLFIYYNKTNNEYYIDIEEEHVKLNTLYIYGTHLNIAGDYNIIGDVDLVLYNGEFISYPININENIFNLSDYVNEGLYLDNIKNGKYYLFLRFKYMEDNIEKYKYYALENDTEYKETVYYTMSNYNKKIVINSKNKYNTLMLTVTDNKNKNVYDVVIDPGHGGVDSGACRYNYCETDFNMDMALKLKNMLESYGMKVKLTHVEDQLSKEDKLPEYGEHGRAVIPYEVHAKYIFSLHFNSSNNQNINGVEIYTAKNINYDFAKLLSSSIVKNLNMNYSINTKHRVLDGVYSKNFSLEDIESVLKDYELKEMVPYEITTKSNYYFIIRETGGIITGAYVDDRNVDVFGNPYVNSNVGCEAYLLELGYISNKTDLNNIINNKDKFVETIALNIKELYNNNY